MSASQTLGGPSRAGRVLGPSLDKIIKNVAWRKHANLVSACKSALDKLEVLPDSSDPPDPSSPLFGFAPSDADFVLRPLVLALDSAAAKVVEPALECSFKLFSLSLIRGELDRDDDDGAAAGDDKQSPSVVFRLLESVCKCCAVLGDEGIELGVPPATPRHPPCPLRHPSPPCDLKRLERWRREGDLILGKGMANPVVAIPMDN